MDEKRMRLNMIKLFGIGLKFANAGIADSDFFYSDIVHRLFDNSDDTPASIEDIFKRLDEYENVNYKDECKQLINTLYKIKKNNETIKLIKSRVEEFEIIGE